MKTRIEVRAQIISCTSCDLSQRCRAPVPYEGPSPAVLAVIGEAPGFQEDQLSKPFVGPSGELLKRMLESAGFDLDEVMFMNSASCFPTDAETGKGRAPTEDEVAACSGNLHDQMELSGATYYLLTGAVPLKAVRPGLKIGQARGRPFLLGSTRYKLGDRLALATYHPSYVLRSGGENSVAWDAVTEDLKYLSELMNVGEKGWLARFPDTCVLCDDWASRFDDDGMGYCDKHWKKHFG